MQCKNCERKITGDFNYCPNCGQKTNVSRLNLKQLSKDVWIAFSNTDEGILLLIKELIYRPGKVAGEYIRGKRKLYLNPFSFLAIMVAIALFFILRFEDLGIDYSQLETEDVQLLRFSFKYFNVFRLVMCPIFAFVIWIFFLRNGYNYIENLVLSAYLSGQTMLYFILAIIIFVVFPSSVQVFGLIIGLAISIWYILAILQFYAKRSFWSILKSIFIILIYQFISQGIVMFAFSIYKNSIL